ncbi:MAG TPA: glycosyltransferase family 1 protein [Candidatus Limnocylindria bacterium]|nr:glycosyltransferase family 1 protein [Candidatus Limnocylindria bacterium]
MTGSGMGTVSPGEGQPIRVLHVVTFMNVGGLECRLMDVYRRMDRQAVQFDFYCCSPGPSHFDEEIAALGGKVFHGPRNSVLDGMRRRPPIYLFLKAHPEYRIVHCHLNQWCGYLLKGAKRAGVTVRIAHSHTALGVRSIRNLVKGIVKTTVNRYATHKFAVSRTAGVWLFGKKAFMRGEVAVLPNAIDTERYRFNPDVRARARAMLGLQGETAVLHVGSMRPEKNHGFLVDVFDDFFKRGGGARLFLAGKPDDGKVKAYAGTKACRGAVAFLGAREDVPDLLQAADVFVFPSLCEGFPGAVLEAQACGLPCVVSDIVPGEIDVTGLVRRVSLRAPVSVWAAAVAEDARRPRLDRVPELAAAGYDVEALALRLAGMYRAILTPTA